MNRYLLDQMAAEGRGEVAYATLIDDGDAIAKTFFERVRNPILTDVTIDWNGLPVTDVLPQRIPDVFSAKPVVVAARYSTAASGTIRIRGYAGGREVIRDVAVTLPDATTGKDAIATLWARQKVAAVSREDYASLMNETTRPDINERIAALGLEFGLMTPFTSFVAVDESPVTAGGDPKRVDVATESADGVANVVVDGASGSESVFVIDGVEVSKSEDGALGVGVGYGEGRGDGVGSGSGTGYGSGSGSGKGTSSGIRPGGASAGGTVEEFAVIPKTLTLSSVVTVAPGVRDADKEAPFIIEDSNTAKPDGIVASGRGEAIMMTTAGEPAAPCESPAASDESAGTVEVTSAAATIEELPITTRNVLAGSAILATEIGRVQRVPPMLATGASPAAPWQRSSTRPAVEIVFAIDTTGSMGGLLDGAKRRVWSIVNEIQRTGCRPNVRIGLVAFRDRGDDYETMVLPLTTDLDLVWVTLNGLTPSGGGDTPENVRRALDDAVNSMGWTPASTGLSQVIFLVGDAPPQEYRDEPDVLATAAAALERGIVVHAIQCGNDHATRTAWTQIAARGAGSYFPIPEDATVAVSLRTPYDAVLAELGRKIGDTYTPYGSPAAQEAANARQAGFERSAAAREARAVAADRAVNKAVNTGAYAGDFLQAIENGELKLENVAPSDLPQDLRGLSSSALRAEVDRRIAERQSLRAAILDLARLRDTYRERSAANPGDPNAKFDTAVGEAVRKQLGSHGKPCE